MSENIKGFDLNHKLKTDGEFQYKLNKVLKVMLTHEPNKNFSARANKEYNASVVDFLKLCNWNIALLLPYYFPKFDKGKPLSLAERPFTVDMMSVQPYQTLVIRGSRQSGKTTSITARDTLAAQLLPGLKNTIITPRTDQIATYANKLKEMEGHFRCYQHHTRFRNNLFYKEYPNKSTIKLVNCLTTASNIRGNSTDFMSIDECITKSSMIRLDTGISINILDIPLHASLVCVDHQGNLSSDFVKGIKAKGKRPCWRLVLQNNKQLECTSNEKIYTSTGWTYLGQLLPKEEGRHCERLRSIHNSNTGTAGHADRDNARRRSIKHKSRKQTFSLLRYTRFLRNRSYTFGKLVSRQKHRSQSPQNTALYSGVNKKGFRRLHRENKVFRSSKYVLQNRYSSSLSRRNVYLSLLSEAVSAHFQNVKQKETSFVACFQESTRSTENVTFVGIKEITYIGEQEVYDIEMEKYHNFFANDILVHNCQDFDLSLEVELEEIQSASSFPNTIYSGTSLRTDSALEAKWNRSSRGIWTMKCGGCNHYNQPISEGNVMDMIQPAGPCCTKCGKPIDVAKGQWIHESPDLLAAGYKGLHVPKIIVPAIANNPFKWNRIYMQSKTIDQRKFFQEILGIATEEGERELSLKQLETICILGPSSKLKNAARNREYRYVISGCDWGGSDYIQALGTKTSFTVHAMLGITNTGHMHIIHLRQYSGMHYAEVAGDIIHNHKALNGFAMGSDFGVGMQYNNYLREHLVPNRHFILNYVGPNSAMFASPKGEHMFNQYSLNKTESITMLYEAIKRQRILCYDWQESGERLTEFLNLIRAPHENAAGNTTFRYIRHGSKSDDTLHAVNFAYTVARLALGEPLFEDRSLSIHIDKMLNESAVDPFGGVQYVSG